jgi:hypothetical protein
MYEVNNNGPSTEPCGTPDVHGVIDDEQETPLGVGKRSLGIQFIYNTTISDNDISRSS